MFNPFLIWSAPKKYSVCLHGPHVIKVFYILTYITKGRGKKALLIRNVSNVQLCFE